MEKFNTITNQYNDFKYCLLEGDALMHLSSLPDCSVHCGITSPPYWAQRNYGVENQIGQEKTPQEYIDKLIEIMKQIKRVLRNDGSFWLNIGDGYCNKKIKNIDIKQGDLLGIPWMLALALRKDGWFLRSSIIWKKTNPMPESTTTRPSKSYEYLFLLTKSMKYFYDAENIKEDQKEVSIRRAYSINHVDKRKDYKNPNYAISAQSQDKTYDKMRKKLSTLRPGENIKRNKRDVWEIATSAEKSSHFAVFPEELVQPCILAGTSSGGVCPVCFTPWKRISTTGYSLSDFSPNCRCGKKKPSFPSIVIDPFNGSGTTGIVCSALNRRYIGIEINPSYVKETIQRMGSSFPHIGDIVKDPRVQTFQEILEI